MLLLLLLLQPLASSRCYWQLVQPPPLLSPTFRQHQKQQLVVTVTSRAV
jgi:hypothetical protein